MPQLILGCHLSSSKGFLALGRNALHIGANTFQFFTRNPRGSKAKPLDLPDAQALRTLMAAHGFGPVLAHAPYTLNACSADVVFEGLSVHPGSSKDTMINAALVAMEFNGLLPASDIPRLTEGYEGFFHLCGMKGDVENAETYDAWLATKDRFESLFETIPTAVACDLHPEYLTSKWAHHQGLSLIHI